MLPKKIIFFAVLLAACLNAYESEAGIVFARDGQYAIISETDYSIVKTGDLWEDFKTKLDPSMKEEFFAEYGVRLILEVTPDMERNRFFVCTGLPAEDVFDGCFALKYPEMDFLGLIKQGGPFVVNPSGKKMYKGGSVYDNTTFAELNNYEDAIYKLPTIDPGDFYEDKAFRISKDACFIDEKRLFTSGRVFDISTAPPTFLYNPGILYDIGPGDDCINEKVLNFGSVNAEETLQEYSILDLLTSKEIGRVTMPYDKYPESIGDYFLSKDIKYIISDVRNEANSFAGILRFYDIASNTLKAEIKLPIPEVDSAVGRLGLSKSGDLLFYKTGGDKLFVISVKDTKLLKKLILPFEPDEVIWP
ncbi:MAG: hypothetical protein OEV59_04580 [Deltaproteobacteria bacterium]|nr:hypothetical protein [Deltaproteobacteria bacterium]